MNNSPSPKAKRTPEKIIYILGPGRCGTTLLEVLLDNNTTISGVGELTHIFRDGYIANQQCSCGKKTHDCSIWSRLLKRSTWCPLELEHFSELFSIFSSHKMFPFILFGRIKKEDSAEYAQANDMMFSTLANITQSNVIVDSSKYAGRALVLAKQYPEKVFVIAITRDFEGVLHSFSKQVSEQESKSTFSALLYYGYVLLCMRFVGLLRKSQVKEITYESLCESPVKVLSEIEKFCGIDLEQVKGKLESDESLNIGHIVTGNRFRHQENIKFRSSAVVETVTLTHRVAATLMRYWRKLLGF